MEGMEVGVARPRQVRYQAALRPISLVLLILIYRVFCTCYSPASRGCGVGNGAAKSLISARLARGGVAYPEPLEAATRPGW
jgi:hypothetical protein